MTPGMSSIGHHILQHTKSHPNLDPNNTTVEDLNSLVATMYDNQYFPPHRDILWQKDGQFNEDKNSQQKNTPAYILALGDPRILVMQLMRHAATAQEKLKTKGKPIPIDSPHAKKEFVLSHGDLFVLQPRDEKTAIRPFFDTEHPTFWQHRVKLTPSSTLPLGLVFRSVVNHREVYRKTGQLVLSASELKKDHRSKFKRKCIELMETHTADSNKAQRIAQQESLLHLYNDMKRRHFFPSITEQV
jgi:hypothetical protein